MPRFAGLSTRLLVAQVIVLIAATMTAAAVALIVGPTIFHRHLIEAGVPMDSPEFTHTEMAFADASTLSLGIALATAFLFAIGVTWFVTRRLQAPLLELSSAAREVSRGHHGVRVRLSGAGPEFEAVGEAFNLMAGQLEQTEDTRRRLLSDVAHELRTPVATIRLYSEGLIDGVTTWNDDTARVFTDQTARLARLANDIDEVSRAEEGRLDLDCEEVSVDELAEAAVRAARERFADTGVDLQLETAGSVATDSPTVLVDRRRMGQVLDNLLSNALRHTPRGGSVVVGASRSGDEVVITVRDTGDGLTPDQLTHVFERFYRGATARERDRSGSGIGLTISRAIVDAHGGAIVARSDGAGLGATFVVSIPAK